LSRRSDCIVSNPRIFKDEAIQVLLRKKKFESTKRLYLFKPLKLLAMKRYNFFGGDCMSACQPKVGEVLTFQASNTRANLLIVSTDLLN
jgi:hypothetical protein